MSKNKNRQNIIITYSQILKIEFITLSILMKEKNRNFQIIQFPVYLFFFFLNNPIQNIGLNITSTQKKNYTILPNIYLDRIQSKYQHLHSDTYIQTHVQTYLNSINPISRNYSS